MRSFVALPLPDDVRRDLGRLASEVGVGRVVSEENLHLTLAFLGDQRPESLQDLHAALSEIRMATFALRLCGLDVFGGKAPRLLQIKAELSEPLSDLHRQVGAAVRAAGLTVERRRFRPHVTLVRFGKQAASSELLRLGQFMAEAGVVALPAFFATSFSIFRSDLSPGGSVYTELASYPLASDLTPAGLPQV